MWKLITILANFNLFNVSKDDEDNNEIKKLG